MRVNSKKKPTISDPVTPQMGCTVLGPGLGCPIRGNATLGKGWLAEAAIDEHF